ncbi:succinylglutamate desuccinylase/aspartoacylase family protein [Aerophototrophica crusticola]|uniref:Succinylglutamate desuccinylase/aspartoacylase family protein n=1 Tax=Aerophototrophica crusticola TaxID=1709002 RepID=A0A858R417_9PROT|nr:succinylglutamate desuccinylase/aspartoacylase family protein [Rhodospirillaceae bacterium B3]
MTHAIDIIPLPFNRPGTGRSLRLHRFGRPGAGPKAYVQAGLHAGELPGMLVALDLVAKLAALDAAGQVRGEVLVLPLANPIGFDQVFQGRLLGRFELGGGVNFNRAYADLTDAVERRVRGQLGLDAATNVALVRQALRDSVAELVPQTDADALRKLLLGFAVDADVMLDLHCDSDAVMHLYTGTELWPGFADLSARLGCHAALLAGESGGDPFDEACSSVWWKLRARLPDGIPLPPACAATTIELRGEADVDDTQAKADADAILDHLRVRGVLAGTPAPLPAALCEGTPLAGVDRVRAPVAGVIAYHAALGDRVEAGQVVADIVDPWSGERFPCRAQAAGPVWSRRLERFATAGEVVMSIAGTEPLKEEGSGLLTAR